MKILNFGSLNIDYVYEVAHFVTAGETLDSQALEVHAGGKGLNQSIALARSGAYVWHAGVVGRDDGAPLVKLLQSSGVRTEFITSHDGPSGHAIIQRQTNGENSILLFGGANHRVTPQLIDQALTPFGAGDWLILQNEISGVSDLLAKASAKGMITVFNPSPCNEALSAYPLDLVDWFILNEGEASQLTGTVEDHELLDALSVRFPTARFVLTLGSRGSVCRDGVRIHHQSIFPVQAVDTTAAGDTFLGFFIGSLTQGSSVPDALKRAAAAAALSVTRPGAAPSIPQRLDIEKFILQSEVIPV